MLSLAVGDVAARGKGKPVAYFDSPQQHYVTSRPQELPYKTAKPVLPPTGEPTNNNRLSLDLSRHIMWLLSRQTRLLHPSC